MALLALRRVRRYVSDWETDLSEVTAVRPGHATADLQNRLRSGVLYRGSFSGPCMAGPNGSCGHGARWNGCGFLLVSRKRCAKRRDAMDPGMEIAGGRGLKSMSKNIRSLHLVL